MREFKDIPHEELQNAIVEMLDKLDISGSLALENGGYSIYEAIYKEQEKARNFKEPEDLN